MLLFFIPAMLCYPPQMISLKCNQRTCQEVTAISSGSICVDLISNGLARVGIVALIVSPAIWENGEMLNDLLTCLVNVKEQPLALQQQGLLAEATAQQLTDTQRQLLQFDVTLTAGEMRNIAEVMAGRYPGAIILIEQWAGQGVKVAPGWLHWVCNNTNRCVPITHGKSQLSS